MTHPPFEIHRHACVGTLAFAGLLFVLGVAIALAHPRDPAHRPDEAAAKAAERASGTTAALFALVLAGVGVAALLAVNAAAAADAARDGERDRLQQDLAARTGERDRLQQDLAAARRESAARAGELTVLRAGFAALDADGAEADRLRAEIDRLTRHAGRADPARKEALVRLLEERAAAREDAVLDADDAVREARLAALDDEFGPKIEAAYDAL